MSKRESRKEFERPMAFARKVMDDRWVVLSALALSDEHPDADVETLLEMAHQRGRMRKR